jgi:hypothetical protein
MFDGDWFNEQNEPKYGFTPIGFDGEKVPIILSELQSMGDSIYDLTKIFDQS